MIYFIDTFSALGTQVNTCLAMFRVKTAKRYLFAVVLLAMMLQTTQVNAANHAHAQTIPITALAFATQPSAQVHIEQFTQCEVKLTAIMWDSFVRAKIFAQLVQHNLAKVYAYNSFYKQDNINRQYLSDGIYGQVTQEWLSYFCAEFALNELPNKDISSSERNPSFVEQLLEGLVTVSAMTTTYPTWRATLSTPAFKNWASAQYIGCGTDPSCYGSPEQLYALLDQYNLQPHVPYQPNSSTPDYYQLNSDDIAFFSDHNTALEALNELKEARYETQQALKLVYVPLLSVLGISLETNLATLLIVKEDISSDIHSDSTDDTPAITAAPIFEFSINHQRLEQLLAERLIRPVSAPQLEIISTLEGLVFRQAYLLSASLKRHGMTHITPATQKLIFSHSKKSQKQLQLAKPNVRPALAKASENCGCSPNLVNMHHIGELRYGFIADESSDVTIDYSQLSRLGVFAASVLVKDDSHALILPAGWHGSGRYSRFSLLAHKHRVKVDLIIANQRGVSYPPTLLSPGLINDISNALKKPIQDNIINKLKPWLSFATSPSRTLADGVTLDFDLTHLSSAHYDDFIDFIKQLKWRLNQSTSDSPLKKQLTDIQSVLPDALAGVATDDALNKAAADDRYYLNMMVPVDDLLTGQGFYTLENLITLAPHVNVFIMVFDPIVPSVSDYPAASTDVYESMVALRLRLAELKYSQNMEPLFNKMVPLLAGLSTEHSANNSHQYSHWSYHGQASWTLPNNNVTGQVIAANILTQVQQGDVIQALHSTASWVCDNLCPQRWIYRTVLFCLFILTLCYLFFAIWFFRLRALLRTWLFILYSAAVVVFLMLVFSCDPFWQAYRLLMLVFFVLFIVAMGFIARIARGKSGRLP
ncbi:MAG: hypothetical protein V5786_07870 [Psychromonas sp.]